MSHLLNNADCLDNSGLTWVEHIKSNVAAECLADLKWLMIMASQLKFRRSSIWSVSLYASILGLIFQAQLKSKSNKVKLEGVARLD